jgi:hypothetical protein
VNHPDPRPRQRASPADANPTLRLLYSGSFQSLVAVRGSRARVFFRSPCPHFLLSISNGHSITVDAMRVEPPFFRSKSARSGGRTQTRVPLLRDARTCHNQIADLRVLQHRCAALGAELVIIGAIAYQIHFPAIDRAGVMASLDTTCTRRGHVIPPGDLRQIDTFLIECPKCGDRFDASERKPRL